MGFDDYVADVNADAKCDTHVFRIIHCKFADTVLELRRGANCLDSTRKAGSTKRTWQPSSAMSAFGGETDMELTGRHFRF
jgi:hypothetical protein